MTKRTGLLALLPDDSHTDQRIAAYELVRALTAQMRALRRGAGLSQKQIGDAIGVSQGRISQIESGLPDEAPNLDMVARYAEACGYQLVPTFRPLKGVDAVENIAPLKPSRDRAAALQFLTGTVIEVGEGLPVETAIDLTIEEDTGIAAERDEWIVIPPEKA